MPQNGKPGDYRRLCRHLDPKGWICMGSAIKRTYTRLNAKARRKKCGPYYSWTRKVDNKTVTTALTKQQYHLIQEAIHRHRQIDTNLVEMQKISITRILSTTTCVPRRKRK